MTCFFVMGRVHTLSASSVTYRSSDGFFCMHFLVYALRGALAELNSGAHGGGHWLNPARGGVKTARAIGRFKAFDEKMVALLG